MKVLAFILSLLTAADMCVGQNLRTVDDTFQIKVSGDCDKKDMCLAHKYDSGLGFMNLKPCRPRDAGNTYHMADNGALLSSGMKDNKFKYYQATASEGRLKMKPATRKKQPISSVRYHKKKIWMFNPIHETLIYAGNHKKGNTVLFYPAVNVKSCEATGVKLNNYMQDDKEQNNKFKIVYLPACPANPDDLYTDKNGKKRACSSLNKLNSGRRGKYCNHKSDNGRKDARTVCKLECKICF